MTCCAFGKKAADVLSGLSIATTWESSFCTLFRLDRRNNQTAATSTTSRTTGMVAGNILSRCFEDDESIEDRTELLAKGTTEDAD